MEFLIELLISVVGSSFDPLLWNQKDGHRAETVATFDCFPYWLCRLCGSAWRSNMGGVVILTLTKVAALC